MTKLPVAMLLFLGVARAPCQVPTVIERSDLAHDPTAAGSTLKFFEAVDDGVYKGSRPKREVLQL
jgi:hypothetical protein